MRSGGHSHRNRRADLPQVTASDPLPTAAIIIAVKRCAASICGVRGAACAWPDLDAAKAWIDLIPLVALAALGELCVGVAMSRLARCVGLDPLDGPDALASRKADPQWAAVADAIEDVVLACGGGR